MLSRHSRFSKSELIVSEEGGSRGPRREVRENGWRAARRGEARRVERRDSPTERERDVHAKVH